MKMVTMKHFLMKMDMIMRVINEDEEAINQFEKADENQV